VKIPYETEALAFLKLKAAGQKTTIKDYCQRQSGRYEKPINVKYFQKVLSQVRRKPKHRLQKTTGKADTLPSKSELAITSDPAWPAFREKFMAFEIPSLAALAKSLNLRKDHKGFRAATKNWHRERKALKPAAQSVAVEQMAKTGGKALARDICAEFLKASYLLADTVLDAVEGCKRWKERDKSQWHTDMAATAVLSLLKAMERLLPVIRGFENMQGINKIFDEIDAGKIGIVSGALALARLGVTLPRPIEILLQKHQADELPPDSGQEISDEMIMARRAQLLAEINNEKTEFVPMRKKMVAEMKAEIADPFLAEKGG